MGFIKRALLHYTQYEAGIDKRHVTLSGRCILRCISFELLESLSEIGSILNMDGTDAEITLDLLVDHGNLNHQLVQPLLDSWYRGEEISGQGCHMLGLVDDVVCGRTKGKVLDRCLIKNIRIGNDIMKEIGLTLLNEGIFVEVSTAAFLLRA